MRINPSESHACSYSPTDAEISGLRFCRRVLGFQTVESTNTLAKKLAAQGDIQPGTLLPADEQTQGRGRMSHSWHSPRGEGIYVSLYLDMATPPERSSFVTLATGCALHQTFSELMNEHGVYLDIKWPNDILWQGRKLAGILVEADMRNSTLDGVVIGIGINVTNRDFPEEIRSRAVSLFQITGKIMSRQKVLVQVLKNLDATLTLMEGGKYSEIRQMWEEASSFARGRKIKFYENGRPVTGTTSGLQDDGALLVSTRENRNIAIYGGEIFEQ